ncbi:MAG: SEC-C metal-binding domain-containing protein [Sulfuricellaceae bacterium]
MAIRIGRNDPCRCGSGKKYKHCCLFKDDKDTIPQRKTVYRFEAGSYGDVGRFKPSLACLKSTGNDGWQYHFVLVKPTSVHAKEDHATAEAEKDLSDAFKVKEAQGSDAELAMALREKGYLSVDNFNIVGGN